MPSRWRWQGLLPLLGFIAATMLIALIGVVVVTSQTPPSPAATLVTRTSTYVRDLPAEVSTSMRHATGVGTTSTGNIAAQRIAMLVARPVTADVAASLTSPSALSSAAKPVPGRVARVIEDRVGRRATTLGAPGEADVFVTGADDIAGLSAREIGEKLALFDNAGNLRTGPFSVFEFDTPIGIASPIRRSDPGFVGGGRTAGGASEYVVPNSRIDSLGNVRRRTVR